MSQTNNSAQSPPLPDAAQIEAITRGAHGDPFAILGMHGGDNAPVTVSVFAPRAHAVEVIDRKTGRRAAELTRLEAKRKELQARKTRKH